jgi:integrase
MYLDFLERSGLLSYAQRAASFVTPGNVARYKAELDARVRSVTVWNAIYKLRRAAQLIAPGGDFNWLAEIEKDIALVMEPRSKADRLVLATRLVEAGLTMIKEAEMFGKTAIARAKGLRNGLIIALLGLHPMRIKNFAALTIGDTFVNLNGRWWLHTPAEETKSHGIDERQVPKFMTEIVNRYINVHSSVLCRGNIEQCALWISSTTGQRFTAKNLGTLISKLTLESIGVDVSPHLFRTAAASTAAIYAADRPHLPSALLNHRDPRIAEDHYNFSTGLRAGDEYAAIARLYRSK